MAVPSHVLGRAVVLAAAFAASSSMLAAQCAIDPAFGTNLGLTDDSVSPAQPLGFTFAFNGVNYDSVVVSSNGFLYLWDSLGSVPLPTGSLCCNGSSATLLASASPMICGLWQDLNPTNGGSVNFNALPGKALITWDNVPEYPNNGTNSFQITLHANGVIDMFFDGNAACRTHTALTGWSEGAGATDPGASDLSALPLFPTTQTVYELFQSNTFDLAGGGFQASPSGTGWVITPGVGCARVDRYGAGCPKPCEPFYELFTGSTFDMSGGSLLFTNTGNGYLVTPCAANCFDTNFSGALALIDDSLAVGQALGFSFPFCGGSTSAIDVCSNGYIWLVSGSSTTADFSPSAAELLTNNPARLAACWMDLNPAAGGVVYFDALPGKAMVTWNQVYAYGTTSPNTMQLQLFPNGDFILAWPTLVNNATTTAGDAIVGIGWGNNQPDPGSRDLSATAYVVGAGGSPLTLGAQAGSRPILGTTLTLEVTNVRPGTIAAALNLGFQNPNLNLGFLGLPDCTLLSSVDLSLGFVAASPVSTVSFGIPNLPSIIGGLMNTQAAAVDPSLGGALPAQLSNGAQLTFGN